ncbi:2Fe-2S iron-sulfur cluster-binding protein [Streptomyces sp. NPDC002588]|uniref:2Fe-2S iron-sulfur cluster-binding protein n=1 Tax=Streptomyces sp. NPDC002588 TaxID=3154419 RepID=UPI003321FC51
MQITVTTRDGTPHQVEASTGLSLMQNIRNAGVEELEAICGGSLSCATCHVYVDSLPARAELSPRSADEEDLLDACDDLAENSRLSCQVVFDPALDGMRVTIAPES